MTDMEGPRDTRRRCDRQESEAHSYPWPVSWLLDTALLMCVIGSLNLKEEALSYSLLGLSPSIWSFYARPPSGPCPIGDI